MRFDSSDAHQGAVHSGTLLFWVSSNFDCSRLTNATLGRLALHCIKMCSICHNRYRNGYKRVRYGFFFYAYIYPEKG